MQEKSPFTITESDLNSYLVDSFPCVSKSNPYITAEKIPNVLKNIPGLLFTEIESAVITEIIKRDKNGFCNWINFTDSAFTTLSFFVKERSIMDFERKKNDLQFVLKKEKIKELKEYTELATKLLKMVSLKFCDLNKCLTIFLSGKSYYLCFFLLLFYCILSPTFHYHKMY